VTVGKHRIRRLSRGTIVLLVVVGLLATAVGGTAVAAIRYDHSHAGRILPGVTVGGVPVGGMTRAQAIQAVTARAQQTLDRNIEVLAAGKSWTVSLAQLGLAAQVTDAVDQALDTSKAPSLMYRVWHRLTGNSVDKSFPIQFVLPHGPVESFVADLAHQLNLPARDASMNLVNGKIVVATAQTGRVVRVAPGVDALRQAVLAHDSQATVAVKTIAPKVTEKTLGQTIVVNVSLNKLFLYKGVKIIRTYPVATAKAGFLTPPGAWTVTWKEANPTWHNPAPNGWGKGEPLVIPPGPGNPLGTRALHLSADGILIHGTPADYSIGTYASHGCIRMHMWDAEALFNLVQTGTPVFIIGAPPWGITQNPGAAG
jgi:lipoprotein-anchoring transpeptidase ErfK/SrfK